MTVLPVIFEDESLCGFRPLAWSQPVCELRCGILNLRERLRHVTGLEPVLLLRSFLNDLAAAHGHRTGLESPRRHLAEGGRLLLVSGRVGAGWDLLREAWRLVPGQDFAWRDDGGWLVLAAGGQAAQDLLTSWEKWQRAAHESGCWWDPAKSAPVWDPAALGRSMQTLEHGNIVGSFRRIWDLIPATAAALQADLEQFARALPARRSWGIVPENEASAAWADAVDLEDWTEEPQPGVQVKGPGPILLGPGCQFAPGVTIDASSGPVVFGRDVRIMPHCYLEGPLYIGSGSVVKAGCTIYGETSLGAVSKVSGEIGESTFLDLSNKQHEGFIGHAYIGSWCNLGAMTTCSDLKNTYGSIRVDLGDGLQDSGQRFIGVLMGEHCKTAIGTLFNTATSAGFACNIFGSGFPAKYLPCFTWGDGSSSVTMDTDRALATARTVMARRGCRLTSGHEAIFRHLAG